MTNLPDQEAGKDDDDGLLPLVGTTKKDAEALRGEGVGFTWANIFALIVSPVENAINRSRSKSPSERHKIPLKWRVIGVLAVSFAAASILFVSNDTESSNGGSSDATAEAGPIPYAVQPGDTYYSVAQNRLDGTAAEGSQLIAQCYADETRELNDGKPVNELGEVDGVTLMRLPMLVVREDDGTLKLVYWEYDKDGNPVSNGDSPCSAPSPDE